jgi:hypothetical protein
VDVEADEVVPRAPVAPEPAAAPAEVPNEGKAVAPDVKEANKPRKKKAKSGHQYQFLPKWKVSRPWLLFDEEKQKMYCDVCIYHKRGNNFVDGCASLRVDSLSSHLRKFARGTFTKDATGSAAELTSGEAEHAKLYETMLRERKMRSEKKMEEEKSTLESVIKEMETHDQTAITKRLKIVHFLAEHGLANSLYDDVVGLLKDLGTPGLELKTARYLQLSRSSIGSRTHARRSRVTSRFSRSGT